MSQQHIPLCIKFMYGWSCCRRGHVIIKVNKVHPVGTRNNHTAALVKEFDILQSSEIVHYLLSNRWTYTAGQKRFSKVKRAKSASLGGNPLGTMNPHCILVILTLVEHSATKRSCLSFSGNFCLEQTKMPQDLGTKFTQPFGGCLDYEVSSTRFCALAFGSEKVGQTCLPLTKHPRE